MRKEYGDVVRYSALGKQFVLLNSCDVLKEGLIGQADAFSGRIQLPVLKKYILKGLGSKANSFLFYYFIELSLIWVYDTRRKTQVA